MSHKKHIYLKILFLIYISNTMKMHTFDILSCVYYQTAIN
jgi:hypothetical protein